MRSIQSRDNPLFRELAKLNDSSRKRSKSKQTLLDGFHLLEAYLDSGLSPRHILVNSAALHNAEIDKCLAGLGNVPLTLLDDRLFAELSELKTPSGILALIDVPIPDMPIEQSRFALLLEDIQDPGNLGSIIRSAAAAGCDTVFMSNACADAWSPKVLRAAMGGHFDLIIHESQDLAHVARIFPGIKLATSLNAEQSLYETNLRGEVAFLLGNEGAGLSSELADLASEIISIPMAGHIESLNVSVAAAICLFEAVRQRRSP